jgi:hypothetical protein
VKIGEELVRKNVVVPTEQPALAVEKFVDDGVSPIDD